jgi:hypothetical protein
VTGGPHQVTFWRLAGPDLSSKRGVWGKKVKPQVRQEGPATVTPLKERRVAECSRNDAEVTLLEGL